MIKKETNKNVSNWSGNVATTAKHYYEPSTIDELQEIIVSHGKVRICGCAMSPSGVGFTVDGDAALVSMRRFNRIISIDETTRTAKVESGVLIEDLLKALEEKGMTLANHPVKTGMYILVYVDKKNIG